jgi:Tfp pilus assembly protein PilX
MVTGSKSLTGGYSTMQVRFNNEKEIVKANQRGIVLPIIMIIMLSLSVLGLSSLAVWNFNSRSTVLEKNQLKAYYIARSGSEATASYILSNPDALTMKNYVDQLVGHESSAVPLGDGTFKVYVTRANNLINIKSVGTVGSVSRTSTITLNETTTTSSSISLSSTLDMALFSIGAISMNNGTVTGNVGTNSTANGGVTLTGNPKINGNVVIGNGGVINANGTSPVVSKPSNGGPFITGTITSQTANRTYTLPTFPDFPSNLTSNGSLTTVWWPNSTSYITADGQYTDITVPSNLVIDVGSGQRYIRVNNLNVAGSLTLTGSGTLYLYVANTFTLGGSGSINLSGDPTKLIMYYKGSSTLTLAGGTNFYGTIFAKTSNVTLTGGGGLHGNLICGGAPDQNPAQTVNISGGATVIVQAIYAPNAVVNITNGLVTGAIVAKNINISGGATVTFSSSATTSFPSFLWENTGSGVTTYSMDLRV